VKIAPFRLERYFAKYEFSVPYLLCASDCESLELRDLLALETGARERFDSLWLGYTDSQGDLRLRQAIARLYEQTKADQILVHAGAEEAIFNFMNAVLDPRDHLIVHSPCYQSLGEVARSIGAEVSEWQGDAASAWELDLGDLEKLLRPRTRAVVVNFPHNPTGFLPNPEFIRTLSAISDRHGFIVFSDEVYRGLEPDPADRLPAFADVNERAVSLGGMSKTYGLAGLRIGWLATRDGGLFRKFAAFKDYTTICNSAPSEFLAALALRNDDILVGRNLRIIRDNLARLDSFFSSHCELFHWRRPRGGSIAFPGLLRGRVDEFCADLVAKTGVLLLPGTVYGDRFNSFRLGFGRKNLPEALEKFEEHLRALR
jgi:aspartate/methionine/tyrosine aminotransferase